MYGGSSSSYERRCNMNVGDICKTTSGAFLSSENLYLNNAEVKIIEINDMQARVLFINPAIQQQILRRRMDYAVLEDTSPLSSIITVSVSKIVSKEGATWTYCT